MTIEDNALKGYGETNDWTLATWLLKSGKLTNGSTNGVTRNIEPSDIAKYYRPVKYPALCGNNVYTHKFMRRGNIKLRCSDLRYYIEFTKIPTQEQFNVLYNIMKHAVNNGIPIEIVKNDTVGKTRSFTPQKFFTYLQRYSTLTSPKGGLMVYDLVPWREGFYFAIG